MRGDRNLQNPMFLVANAEERLAADHPSRAIKRQVEGKTKRLGFCATTSRHLKGGLRAL